MRIQLRIHLPCDLRYCIERRAARIPLALHGDIIVEICHSDNTRVEVNVLPLDVERKTAPIHALMMLECREAYALRQPRNIAKDLCAIHRMLDIPLVVLARQRINILLEQTLVKFRLADIMQEAREHNILCRLTVQLHPLRDDTRENRDAERVVVDVTRQMIDLVQIVNRPTAARERQEIRLHHLIRLGDGHIPRLFRLLEDRLRRPNHILILLDKEIAAREDRRPILLELRRQRESSGT